MFAAKIPMFAAEITISPREKLAAETLENFGRTPRFPVRTGGQQVAQGVISTVIMR